jgi:hypothetical protein
MSNLDFDDQYSYPEEMNHNEMCSFPNRAHPFFERLLLEVRALIERSQNTAEVQHSYPAGAAPVAETMSLPKVPSITSLEVLSGKLLGVFGAALKVLTMLQNLRSLFLTPQHL